MSQQVLVVKSSRRLYVHVKIHSVRTVFFFPSGRLDSLSVKTIELILADPLMYP